MLFLLLLRVLGARLHALTSGIGLLEIVTHLDVSVLFYVILVLRKVRHAFLTSASVQGNDFPIYKSE